MDNKKLLVLFIFVALVIGFSLAVAAQSDGESGFFGRVWSWIVGVFHSFVGITGAQVFLGYSCGNDITEPGEVCDPPFEQGDCPAGYTCDDCYACRILCNPANDNAECPAGEVCQEYEPGEWSCGGLSPSPGPSPSPVPIPYVLPGPLIDPSPSPSPSPTPTTTTTTTTSTTIPPPPAPGPSGGGDVGGLGCCARYANNPSIDYAENIPASYPTSPPPENSQCYAWAINFGIGYDLGVLIDWAEGKDSCHPQASPPSPSPSPPPPSPPPIPGCCRCVLAGVVGTQPSVQDGTGVGNMVANCGQCSLVKCPPGYLPDCPLPDAHCKACCAYPLIAGSSSESVPIAGNAPFNLGNALPNPFYGRIVDKCPKGCLPPILGYGAAKCVDPQKCVPTTFCGDKVKQPNGADGIMGTKDDEQCEPPNSDVLDAAGTVVVTNGYVDYCNNDCKVLQCQNFPCASDADCTNAGNADPFASAVLGFFGASPSAFGGGLKCDNPQLGTMEIHGHCATGCDLALSPLGFILPGMAPFQYLHGPYAEWTNLFTQLPEAPPGEKRECPYFTNEPCYCAEFVTDFVGSCDESCEGGPAYSPPTGVPFVQQPSPIQEGPSMTQRARCLFRDVLRLITIYNMGLGFAGPDFYSLNFDAQGAMGLFQKLCCAEKNCGDGVVQPPEQCDPGTALAAETPPGQCPAGQKMVSTGTGYQASGPAGYNVPGSGYQSGPTGALITGAQTTDSGYQSGTSSSGTGYQATGPAGYNVPGSGYQATGPAGYNVPGSGYQAPSTPNVAGCTELSPGTYCCPGVPGPAAKCGGGRVCTFDCMCVPPLCGNGNVDPGEDCDLAVYSPEQYKAASHPVIDYFMTPTPVEPTVEQNFQFTLFEHMDAFVRPTVFGPAAQFSLPVETQPFIQAGQPGQNCGVDCSWVFCGDGRTDSENGEECDPPNGLTCLSGCKRNPNCGDGKVQEDEGEQCDPPGVDGCNYDCTLSVCPDGKVGPDEDGEPKSDCDPEFDNKCKFACGNGAHDCGEPCDESVAGMESVCEHCKPIIPAVCGNGNVEFGEDCDPSDGVLCGPDCKAIPCPLSNAKCCANPCLPGCGGLGCGCDNPCCGAQCCGGTCCIGDCKPPPPIPGAVCSVDCVTAEYSDNGVLSAEQERVLRKKTGKDIVSVIDVKACCQDEPLKFTESIPNNYVDVEAFAISGSDAKSLDRSVGQGVLCGGYTTDQIIETPGCVQCIERPESLVSWWPADKHADDIQGVNRGTLVLGPQGKVNPELAFEDGMVQEAFSLDGFDDFVRVGDVLDPGMSSFTIDAWFKLSKEPSEFAIVQKGAYGLFGDSEKVWFVVSDGRNEVKAEVLLPSLFEFHHITGVLDRENKVVRLYLDGLMVDKENYEGLELGKIDTDALFSIGAVDSPPGKFFSGLIDEVEYFDRALEIGEVKAIFTAWHAGKCKECVLPPDGLVSWWTGDRNTKDIIDKNDGVLMLGALENVIVANAYAGGMVGRAFKFDGVDDFVQIADNDNLDITRELTIDLWVKQDSPSGRYVVSKLSGDTGNYGLRVLEDGKLRFVDGVHFVGSDSGLDPGVWNHVAVTVDVEKQEVMFYVNGKLDAVREWPYSLSANDAPLFIGAGEKGIEGFNGLIDEVEIFNRVLEKKEIFAIFTADSKGKCKPYCEEISREYYAEELEMSLVKGSVSGSLSSELPHFDVATTLGQPIGVEMRSLSGAVVVTLKHPSAPLRVDNPEMRAVSGFIVELDNYAPPASLELSVPVPVDDLFADVYIMLGDVWVKPETSRVKNRVVARLKSGDVEKYFVKQDGKRVAVFAVLSLADMENVAEQFTKLYDGGGKTAVVFVHGLTRNRVSMKKFVFEYERMNDDSKVYAFIYSPTKPVDELARTFADLASSRLLQDGVSEVYIVPYSLGGLITQEALKYAKENGLGLADLTDKVVYIGTPFGGVPVLEVLNQFFAYVVNSPVGAGRLNMDEEVLKTLSKGKQESAPSVDVDYGLVIGTRSYPWTEKFFESANDGIVSDKAAHPAWFEENTPCDEDVLRLHVTHDQLPGAWPVREFVYKLTNKKKALDNPTAAILGYSQSVDVRNERCQPGDKIVIVGELVPEEARPHACSCGDDVCGVREDFKSCPSDCATVWQKFNVCLYFPWMINGLLLLLLVVTTIYVYRKEKTHERGRGFAVIFVAIIVVFSMMGVHYFKCEYFLPLAIFIALVLIAMCMMTLMHFKKPKSGRGESALHRLEDIFNRKK